MDDLINIFFENTFTEEQRTLLYKAQGLMAVFGMANYGEEVVNIIMQEGEQHKEEITDQVYAYIEAGVDQLISSHRIILEGEPTLGFKVSLMEGISGLAHREDYHPYVSILGDEDKTNEEKLADIVSDIIGLTSDDIMEHLSWVYEGTIQRLQALVDIKTMEEASVDDIDTLKKIRRNLLVFEAAFGTPKALQNLIELPMAKAMKFDLYYQMFSDEIIDPSDLEANTWRLIWIALISSDGTDNPQKLLMEKAESFFTDLRVQNQFTTMLQKAMGHYQEHKEHLK